MVNVFCDTTAANTAWTLSDTSYSGGWYSTGCYSIRPKEQQKKNPFVLNPVVEVRLFFDDKPKPKRDSFKRTSQITISRIGSI